jgi:ATP-dependent RNA helicase RhlE
MSYSFADLGVSRQVANALAKRGIHKPFAVQRLAIADVLAGRDVLVQSPTGSGKTLAFGAPIADRLAPNWPRPSALVLAPTRELAAQIVDEVEPVARAKDLSIAPVYGGVGFGPQIKRARRAHIVVATPGRLEDLLQRGDLSIDHVRTLVLDEADRMLDMGFKPAVDRIVRQTPAKRQTLFFSATLEGATGKLAGAYTRDARRHVHAPKLEKRAPVTHRFVHVESQGAKLGALVGELSGKDADRALVFVRTKHGADRLVKRLGKQNVRAAAMHGNKSQGQRQRALASFERGDVQTLVATDVAARGIDVADVSHVINFDAPADRDAYLHRVGRTGRAGRGGAGVSFVLDDESREMRRIAADLGIKPEVEGRRPSHGSGHGKGRGNGHANGANGSSKRRSRRRRRR